MKYKILNELKLKGFEENQFKISITSGLTKGKNFKVDCHTKPEQCKYILLYIESAKVILIWKNQNIFEICSISKNKVIEILDKNKKYMIKGIEFSNRKEQKVYISSIDNIGEMISKIDSGEI